MSSSRVMALTLLLAVSVVLAHASSSRARRHRVARAAAGGAIVCDTNVQNPHRSTHFPETVNLIVVNWCSSFVYGIRMRAAIYFNHHKVADTGSVYRGDARVTDIKVAVTCRSGLYQGWGGASWYFPPGYHPPSTGRFGWSRAQTVRC